MNSLARPTITLFLVLTAITGVVYPLVVTGIGQLMFPAEAAGSLVVQDGKAIGSRVIGQSFADPKNFWSRPSATSPQPYNALGSSGSNLGPLNPALTDAVKARVAALQAADPDNKAPIPVDLVTASASGLDPDISIAAASYQVARVARARGLKVETVQALINAHAHNRVMGWFGEPRINVLELNLALEALR
jgi:potassium-transporting ATPase KdpC subunit